MNITFKNIAEALRSEDIEGLIELGAPSDEYDSEAREVASALASLTKNQITEANILAIIALEWAKSFNRSAQEIQQRMPAFRKIAYRILA